MVVTLFTNHYDIIVLVSYIPSKLFFACFIMAINENNGRGFCLTKDEMKGDIKQKPNQFRNFALISEKNHAEKHYLKSLELCLKQNLIHLYVF